MWGGELDGLGGGRVVGSLGGFSVGRVGSVAGTKKKTKIKVSVSAPPAEEEEEGVEEIVDFDIGLDTESPFCEYEWTRHPNYPYTPSFASTGDTLLDDETDAHVTLHKFVSKHIPLIAPRIFFVLYSQLLSFQYASSLALTYSHPHIHLPLLNALEAWVRQNFPGSEYSVPIAKAVIQMQQAQKGKKKEGKGKEVKKAALKEEAEKVKIETPRSVRYAIVEDLLPRVLRLIAQNDAFAVSLALTPAPIMRYSMSLCAAVINHPLLRSYVPRKPAFGGVLMPLSAKVVHQKEVDAEVIMELMGKQDEMGAVDGFLKVDVKSVNKMKKMLKGAHVKRVAVNIKEGSLEEEMKGMDSSESSESLSDSASSDTSDDIVPMNEEFESTQTQPHPDIACLQKGDEDLLLQHKELLESLAQREGWDPGEKVYNLKNVLMNNRRGKLDVPPSALPFLGPFQQALFGGKGMLAQVFPQFASSEKKLQGLGKAVNYVVTSLASSFATLSSTEEEEGSTSSYITTPPSQIFSLLGYPHQPPPLPHPSRRVHCRPLRTLPCPRHGLPPPAVSPVASPVACGGSSRHAE
jgi:hypothetical protein